MADLFPAGIRRAEFRGKQNKLHSVRAYRKQSMRSTLFWELLPVPQSLKRRASAISGNQTNLKQKIPKFFKNGIDKPIQIVYSVLID